jgi:hypothetical protein
MLAHTRQKWPRHLRLLASATMHTNAVRITTAKAICVRTCACQAIRAAAAAGAVTAGPRAKGGVPAMGSVVVSAVCTMSDRLSMKLSICFATRVSSVTASRPARRSAAHQGEEGLVVEVRREHNHVHQRHRGVHDGPRTCREHEQRQLRRRCGRGFIRRRGREHERAGRGAYEHGTAQENDELPEAGP